MGLLPTGLFRSRDARQRLPLYDKTLPPVTLKERYSDSEFTSDDGDEDTTSDDDFSGPSSPFSAHDNSRQSSGTATSSTLMMPKRSTAATRSAHAPHQKASRRRHRRGPSSSGGGLLSGSGSNRSTGPAGRIRMYRLPHRTVRYLCCAMITTIVVLIITLVRASIAENVRVAAGRVNKPPPPPPAWESFDFLTRYYGGVRSLVPFRDNVPQYPREADEQPYESAGGSAVATAAASANKVLRRADAGVDTSADAGADSDAVNSTENHSLPLSAPFDNYPGSVFAAADAASSATPSSSSSSSSVPLLLPAVPCYLDRQRTMAVPPLRYYDGRPSGFPENVMGSYEMLALPEDICFERYGRFGPYGYGYSVRSGGLGIGEYGEREGAEAVWADGAQRVDYRAVDWADVQQRCYADNARRFAPASPRAAPVNGLYVGGDVAPDGTTHYVPRAVDAAANVTDSLSESDAPVAAPAEEKKMTGAAPTTASVAATATLAAAASAPVASAPAAPAAPAPATPVEKEAPPPPQGDAPRTAVVVRCWDEFVWREEDKMNLRSLITELALASGARYDVHLLVQVKNDAKHPIWADDEAYVQRIADTVPAEFRGLVTLWTETQMLSLYQGIHDLFTRGPGLPVHGVYRGLQMAMQHFAYNHPEYAYFWQWEMDIRYTGHHLDLFTKMENWARAQPRKGLWERNARFYVPSVHGTWEDFRQMVRVQTEVGLAGGGAADKAWNGVTGSGGAGRAVGAGAGAGADSRAGEETVWGPVRPADPNDWFEPEADPVPPTTYEKDRYVWGVGEEADLITLNPIFDPEGTTWLLADDITGYNETAEAEARAARGGAGAGGSNKPPRRAQIITASRMSRRLLRTMHRETAFKKHHAFSEMWPATAALQHGYKAVYVPHPAYVDRAWPTQYLAQTFNAGRNGASGGARTSVFGQREHNFQGLTWYYNAGFAPNLYRRWLGLRVNGDGGSAFEAQADAGKNGTTVSQMAGGEGRMCLPPMLLHPVKGIELPVESHEGEED